ncbi:MAG: hypothetical protein ACRDVL_11520 [Acidimicrobiia bacterium]
MSRTVDYSDEMGPLAISDSDVERILRGQAPHGPGLSRLVTVIDELRAQAKPRLRPTLVARHVAMAAEAVRENLAAAAAAEQPSPTASLARSPVKAPRWKLIPRFGVSLATFALLIGMSGVAVAADAAAPGDTLHGIDLALEKIGIGAGGSEERIAEAKDLATAGLPVEALDHVSTAFGNEQSEASKALKEASRRIKNKNTETGLAMTEREEVAAILEWMATADLKGQDFGQGLAERAQELGNGNGEAGADVSGGPQGNGGKGKGSGKSGKGRGR